MKFLLKGYKKLISPILVTLFGHACRFQPTCSEFLTEAIEIHGPARGVWLGIKRLSRCHPLTKIGYDPVPKV